MKNRPLFSLRVICFFVSVFSPLHIVTANEASGKLTISYADNINEEHQHYVAMLQEAKTLEDMLQFIDESVPLKHDVDVIIGAEDGPLYDPNDESIWMPTEFFAEIEQRFFDAELIDKHGDASQAVLDVTLHTLIHEVGHAFIAQHDIPTLGKEEDAVDNLANVLLLEYLEDGDVVALNAASMFALEDGDIDTFGEEDYWGVHSLDIQRYYAIICHVYGALPDENVALIDNGELSEEKGEQCEADYEVISSDWLEVLDSVR